MSLLNSHFIDETHENPYYKFNKETNDLIKYDSEAKKHILSDSV